MINDLLNKDINSFVSIYPNFCTSELSKNFIEIIGEIDICDINGSYWDSFNIGIIINKSKYPYTCPIVREKSKKIERDEDWHISKDGICCIDMDHQLEFNSKKGINLISFYQNEIYPFFTNVIYKKEVGEYANGEYKHNFEGVLDFYENKLKLKNIDIIIEILRTIISNSIPGRNQNCLCGSLVKIKYCHLDSINFLKSLSKETILRDLKNFQDYVEKN